MITSDGWLDWVERQPGPSDKTWPDINAVQGYIPHSAVGSLQGVINVVFGPVSNERSVHGVIGYNARVIQFYPFTASPWASGNREANKRFIAFENEGGRPGNESEPLTEFQITINTRIIKELGDWKNYPVEYWHRPNSSNHKSASLYEHREMTRFGAPPTACPSGRIPWQVILSRLQGSNEMMTPHNAIAAWFTDRSLGPISSAVMLARSDLNLPTTAKMARLDVYLSTGSMSFKHGLTNLLAGVVREYENHAQIDVVIDANGLCGFVVPAGGVEIEQIGCLGYWT